VTYDTTGFLEKNRDLLHSESIQLLSSCKCELLKHFASVMVADSQNKSTLSWHSVVDTEKQGVVTKFKVLIFYHSCFPLFVGEWFARSVFSYIICIHFLGSAFNSLSITPQCMPLLSFM
jgi:hypothetical protein